MKCKFCGAEIKESVTQQEYYTGEDITVYKVLIGENGIIVAKRLMMLLRWVIC